MRRMVCLLTIFSLCSFTIEDPFAALLKKLQEYSKRYPSEKVHLHLDKPYYAAGDNIWFKAYVADVRTSQPTDKADIRTTVFWAPNLVSDETGKVKLDYFNTDQVGNYRIVIEGFDVDGKLARKIYTYKVN